MGQQLNHPPTSVFGPYEVIGNIGTEPITILSRQYSEVQGAQTFVSVVDNVFASPLGGTALISMIGAEISIWGSCQGYETVIKRQLVRNITGAMAYKFEYDEPYDRIIYKARVTAGGASKSINFFAGESVVVTVYIQARTFRNG